MNDNDLTRRKFVRKVGAGLISITVVDLLFGKSRLAFACGEGTTDSACGIKQSDANCSVPSGDTMADSDNNCGISYNPTPAPNDRAVLMVTQRITSVTA